MRRAAGRHVVSKQRTVDGAGKRRVIPVAAERAERIATRALADHHHVGVVLRLHCQHVPGVFHRGKLGHTRLLVEHFLVIHHHVFDEAKYRITGIFKLKHATPGQILYRRNKKRHHAKGQTQAFYFTPCLFLNLLTANRNHAQAKNEKANHVVVPREDRQDLRGLFHIGRVQRQQGIKVRRAVGLAKREIGRGDQRTDPDKHFLHARCASPQQVKDAGKPDGIKQAEGIAKGKVNQQRLQKIESRPRA